MRKVVDDRRLIYKCCKLYYEEDLSQQEIADRLAVSRVSVNRMLQAGREQGMVIIRVVSPNLLEYSQLEQKLEQLFGLKEAVVVENSPLNTRYDHINALGLETIKLLETYLHDGDLVGVSMGMTLHNICRTPRQDSEDVHCTFVARFRPKKQAFGHELTEAHIEELLTQLRALEPKRRKHFKGWMQALEALENRLYPTAEEETA